MRTVICLISLVLIIAGFSSLYAVDSRETITLPGLIVKGSEKQVYKDKIILIKGDIVVQDDAELQFLNCKICPQQEFHQQYTLKVKDRGHLVVKKSYLVATNNTWHNWNYHDKATVDLEDFDWAILWQCIDSESDCVFHATRANVGLTICAGPGEKTVIVKDSPSVYFELGLPPGKHRFSLPDRETKVTKWVPPIPGKIEVHNSVIKKMDVDLKPGVHVEIHDTNDLSLGWVLTSWDGNPSTEQRYAKISGLKKKYYTRQTFAANDASLTLVNTSMDLWWPTSFGSIEVEIEDADMADPRSWNDSKMKITNSRMYLFAANDNSISEIHNSSVDDNLHASGTAQLSLSQITKGPQYTTSTSDKGILTEIPQ
ncbi:MAG: hypothetical protein HRU15_16385 [Planctomycetes bacterium]|nr:hypothetical protein [Planctomycetota bacterium]